MSGPPGSGKTLLARALPSILPAMTVSEALDVTKIYSVRGLLPPETPMLRERPFRSPHHTISAVGLVGGGAWPRPGEISLAHRGVLFLDELPEFAGSMLEGLRQPLEDKRETLARAASTLTFPATSHSQRRHNRPKEAAFELVVRLPAQVYVLLPDQDGTPTAAD